MAVIIEANYSKKLGLPAYSSHSYSVTLRTEVADLPRRTEVLHALFDTQVGLTQRERN